MKKLISFFTFAVLMVAMCMTVTSCSDDDDKDDNKEDSSKLKEMVGNWLLLESRAADDTEWTECLPTEPSFVLQFDENGNVKLLVNGRVEDTGTCKADGKKIVATWTTTMEVIELKNISKDKNSMELLLYAADGKTPEVYYRYSRCAATPEEAKALLMTQWKSPNTYQSIDEEYVDYSVEGKEIWFNHIRKNLSPGQDYYEYRNRYVGWDNSVYNVMIFPDRVDPTNVKVEWESPVTGDVGTVEYSMLCYQSFRWGIENQKFTRVEKPITYEVVSSGE